jgi:hypothetical protein
MITFSIKGATPPGGKPLCHSCKYASIVRGQNCEERIICRGGMFQQVSQHSYGVVTFRVAECGTYHPDNVPWLNEMKEMAWIVEVKKRGYSGFSNPQDIEVVVSEPVKIGGGTR